MFYWVSILHVKLRRMRTTSSYRIVSRGIGNSLTSTFRLSSTSNAQYIIWYKPIIEDDYGPPKVFINNNTRSPIVEVHVASGMWNEISVQRWPFSKPIRQLQCIPVYTTRRGYLMTIITSFSETHLLTKSASINSSMGGSSCFGDNLFIEIYIYRNKYLEKFILSKALHACILDLQFTLRLFLEQPVNRH